MLKQIKYISLLGVVMLLLNACSKKKELSKEDYLHQITEPSGSISVSQDFKDISFTAKYRPLEEMVLFNLKDSALTKESFDTISAKYSDMHYFTFTIISNQDKEIIAHNNTNQNDYFMNLDYLVNSIQNDFYLLDGKDTLPCSMCHYERNYGISSKNNLNLAFEKKQKTVRPVNEMTLVYEDKMFQVGAVKFHFEKETIENLPELIYEKN